ncbi:MAG: hypothetical protein OEW02_09070, partial [Myxococcales bacterium]|nr:hypothetical protein [Myxococcales bacterium]
FAGMTIVGILGSFFLPWYDDPRAYASYGIEGIFDTLVRAIRWVTFGVGVLTIFLAIAARRVEPRDA